MNSELLSLDTAAKLARYDKTIKFLNTSIKADKMFCDKHPDAITTNEVYREICTLEEILNMLEGQDETKNILNEEVK